MPIPDQSKEKEQEQTIRDLTTRLDESMKAVIRLRDALKMSMTSLIKLNFCLREMEDILKGSSKDGLTAEEREKIVFVSVGMRNLMNYRDAMARKILTGAHTAQASAPAPQPTPIAKPKS